MNNNRYYQLVIFDMDGVILDSESIYINSLQKCLKDLKGVNYSIQNLSEVIGMNNNDINEYLIKEYSISIHPNELQSLQDDYFDKELECEGIHEMTGLTEFLNYLSFQKYKIALASSSDLGWIHKVLNTLQIKKYFDIIISGDDVIHSKPRPEIFLTTVNRANVNRKKSIIIEDSRNGILAGVRAGIDVIAFKGSSIQQDTSLAKFEVKTFEEIKQIL